MSIKPENTFRNSVHKHFLSSALHHEKMSNPYRAGGADDWYSGKGKHSTDLWIEWKFVVLPVRDDTPINLVAGKRPSLSHLQQDWLAERHAEGRNVCVGIGTSKGGFLIWNREWERESTAREYKRLVVPRAELAERIVRFVQGKGP